MHGYECVLCLCLVRTVVTDGFHSMVGSGGRSLRGGVLILIAIVLPHRAVHVVGCYCGPSISSGIFEE